MQGLRHPIAVHFLEADQGIEYVTDSLEYENLQNTQISMPSTTTLRQEVFAKL